MFPLHFRDETISFDSVHTNYLGEAINLYPKLTDWDYSFDSGYG